MKGISFVSSEADEEPRRRRPQGDIEYTSGARLDEPPRFHAPPKGASKPKEPAAVKEKKPSRFALWRHKRQAERAAKAAEQPVEAPRIHQGERLQQQAPASDLLNAQPVTEPAPPTTPPAPRSPLPAAPTAPVAPIAATSAPAPVQRSAGIHAAPPHAKEHVGADLLHGTPGHAPTPRTAAENKPASSQAKRRTKGKGKPKKAEADVRLDVNLVPRAEQPEHKPLNRLHALGYVAAANVIVVLAAFGVMRWYQSQIDADIARTNQQIQDVNTQIAGYGDLRDTVDQVTERLEGTEEVLEAHIYWTPLLELVEGATLPTVYYRSMTGSALSGEFTFDVVARDYGQVEPQVRQFERLPEVETVSVTSAVQSPASAIITLDEGEELPPEIAALFAETEAGVAPNPLDEVSLATFTMNVNFDPLIFRFPSRILADSEIPQP
jgi:hypothetical protein